MVILGWYMKKMSNTGKISVNGPLSSCLRFFSTQQARYTYTLSDALVRQVLSALPWYFVLARNKESEAKSGFTRFMNAKNENIDRKRVAELINTFNQQMYPWMIIITFHGNQLVVDYSSVKQMQAVGEMAQIMQLSAEFERACADANRRDNVAFLDEFCETLMARWVECWKTDCIKSIAKNPQQLEPLRQAIQSREAEKAATIIIEGQVKPMLFSYFTELSRLGADLSESTIQALVNQGCDLSRDSVNNDIAAYLSKNNTSSNVASASP